MKADSVTATGGAPGFGRGTVHTTCPTWVLAPTGTGVWIAAGSARQTRSPKTVSTFQVTMLPTRSASPKLETWSVVLISVPALRVDIAQSDDSVMTTARLNSLIAVASRLGLMCRACCGRNPFDSESDNGRRAAG